MRLKHAEADTRLEVERQPCQPVKMIVKTAFNARGVSASLYGVPCSLFMKLISIIIIC